ncbi:mu-type opioid receptor-like [Saccoglossus kowalevskii]|uniref:Mu-type opioid receptor-like n=1 Tax=Saccoglossus kowalevskii TaxID=10224 RepID=A0ABM0LX46_SACKO|nr:PREDICTED: mu-type opioid receptor-like [Saccoglossus kowalevskii]
MSSPNVGFNINWTYSGIPSVCQVEQEPLMYAVITIALLGFIGNALFIFVVARVKSMRTLPNYFIINLACTDLLCLFGFLLFPLLNALGATHIVMVVYLRVLFMDIATFTSIFTVLLITIDRYIAICHPLKASRIQGKRRMCNLTVLAWILGMCLGLCEYLPLTLSPINNTNTAKITLFLFLAFAVIPLICIGVLYGFIARRLMTADIILEKAHSRSKWRREKQVLLVCTLVLVVFFICILPQICMLIYAPFMLVTSMRVPVEMTMCFAVISPLMMIINFAVNPFIYNLPSRNQRRAFLLAFGGKRGKRYQNSFNSRNYSLTSV